MSLQLLPTNDKELLDNLSLDIFNKKYEKAVGYVLYSDDNAIGVATLTINGGGSVIESLGIIKTERGKGYGDFFTRSLLHNLSNVSLNIEIGYMSDYFIKFGFAKDINTMKILSSDLKFPRKCCDNH